MGVLFRLGKEIVKGQKDEGKKEKAEKVDQNLLSGKSLRLVVIKGEGHGDRHRGKTSAKISTELWGGEDENRGQKQP